VTGDLDRVRAHLRNHFVTAGITGEPAVARVTFVGVEPIEVLRFGPGTGRIVYYASVGCARHPMGDPSQILADPLRGPRAEVVLRLRVSGCDGGLARSLAVLAAAPAVEGVVLCADALVDLGGPMWNRQSGAVPFTAVLLSDSDVDDLPLEKPRDPVHFLSATPITATEAAWIRLRGADAMRAAWRADGVDVLDPDRPASEPH
jgi:hypothetical protein